MSRRAADGRQQLKHISVLTLCCVPSAQALVRRAQACEKQGELEQLEKAFTGALAVGCVSCARTR